MGLIKEAGLNNKSQDLIKLCVKSGQSIKLPFFQALGAA
jgi:hypothetical protein